MEHVKVKNLANGYYKLTPDKGYVLTDGHNTFTSAVTKTLDGWSAIEIENT
jgi:hypothetical protein